MITLDITRLTVLLILFVLYLSLMYSLLRIVLKKDENISNQEMELYPPDEVRRR